MIAAAMTLPQNCQYLYIHSVWSRADGSISPIALSHRNSWKIWYNSIECNILSAVTTNKDICGIETSNCSSNPIEYQVKIEQKIILSIVLRFENMPMCGAYCVVCGKFVRRYHSRCNDFSRLKFERMTYVAVNSIPIEHLFIAWWLPRRAKWWISFYWANRAETLSMSVQWRGSWIWCRCAWNCGSPANRNASLTANYSNSSIFSVS